MKIYIKFLIFNYFKSFLSVSLILLSLLFILNVLTEIEFFKDIPVKILFPIFIAFLNSPSFLFEMFPFIFLLSTQVFFLNLFSNNQLQTFKYSGLKNSQIIKIISIFTFLLGIFLITVFYNFSSNLKNYYLESKFKFTTDSKYLAVITNNGLWIKDISENTISIINSEKINNNRLVNSFITQFDLDYNFIRNISSESIDISSNDWILEDAKIFNDNFNEISKNLVIKSNFDYQKIKNLFSNLSSLSLLELISLKKNYKMLNLSTIEINIQILKILVFPIYLTLMTILSSVIMFNTNKFKSNTLKIIIGLFLSVLIYYINNFFSVMGNTEKLSVNTSVFLPLLILSITIIFMARKINEK